MLSIIPQQEIQNGSVRFSWCTSKEVINKYDAASLAVVLITVPRSAHESNTCKQKGVQRRFVYRFTDGAGYVDVQRAGEFDVYGVLMPFSNKFNEFVNDVQRTDFDYEFIRDFVEADGTQLIGFGFRDNIAYCSVAIDVPEGVFAKEPPQWEKNWVNLFFRGRPDDQCDYRKRRIFAYTVQPILGIIRSALFLVLTLVANLFGFKGQWRGVLHPFQHEVACLESYTDHLVLEWADKKWPGTDRASFIAILGSPIVYPALVFVYRALSEAPLLAVLKIFGWAVLVALCGIAALGLVGTIAVKAEAKYQQRRRESAQLLVCGNEKEKSRPIKLIFRDVKAKVCRPFQA